MQFDKVVIDSVNKAEIGCLVLNVMKAKKIFF